MFGSPETHSKTVLVIRLESDTAIAKVVTVINDRASIDGVELLPKDMHGAKGEIESNRISDVIRAFTNQVKSEFGVQPEIVAVSCPGTISSDCRTIIKSSRLGILEPLPCGELLKHSHQIDVCVFNDAICMAKAELKLKGEILEDAVFIMVGQGVGCAIYVRGELYVGAGVGGHVGRLVVNPSGPMSSRFNQSGTVEAYASHESIAQRLINMNKDDLDKTSEDELSKAPYYHFRQVLKSANRSLDVDILQIAQALEQKDPIVIESIRDAAKYLGQCISYIITILNPRLIVVGGELIDGLPTYFELAANRAKRLSSRLAWERTELTKASMGTAAQFIGAAELALSLRDGK